MINGFLNEDRYLDYESRVLEEITQDKYSMAKAIIDAWVPEDGLRVDCEEEFRDQLIDILSKQFNCID